MPDLIKNNNNRQLLNRLACDIQSVYSCFQIDDFINSVIDDTWGSLELKDRIYKIARELGKFLPADYEEAINIIDKVVMNYGTWLDNLGGFFPIFVELYGQDDINWNISMGALERYTTYASSEIAVRPFIIYHEERMMKQMYVWSKHENECVRRLASEGCRPALPWAPAINSFKKDPTPIFPILEQLKTDSSLHVRKSVANNLNDISKTHPELIIKLAKEWYGKNEYTNWIVKHGCRTLLKKGNNDALNIFGYNKNAIINIEEFDLNTTNISLGDDLIFKFIISVNKETKIRLEYGIDYVKANGKRNRKIFKISEIILKDNQKKVYVKKHSFTNLSTRKHYPGIHSITLIVNGKEYKHLDFQLII